MKLTASKIAAVVSLNESPSEKEGKFQNRHLPLRRSRHPQ